MDDDQPKRWQFKLSSLLMITFLISVNLAAGIVGDGRNLFFTLWVTFSVLVIARRKIAAGIALSAWCGLVLYRAFALAAR